MAKQAAAQLAKANVVAPAPQGAVFQRKCACGNHTVAGGECDECRKASKTVFRKANHQSSGNGNSTLSLPAVQPAPNTRGQSSRGEETDETDEVTGFTSRPAAFRLPNGSAQPMERPLRQFMEARFKHDFSGVRLHTDPEAAASARSIGALAYTFDQNIVFDSSSYQPNTPHGLHLIAHELSHVVQQSRHPLPKTEELKVESETSNAEVEADHMALAVLTPGPVRAKPSARPTGLNRGIGWAFLGGLIGAVVGGLLGALGGPVGAVIGGIAGAALGAWIAGSLSNDKTKNNKGTARQRIHRLLTRTATDWVITDEEALEALAILQEVEKKNPEELFEIALMMKMSGEWAKLREELPAFMRTGLDYFDMVPLNPNRGLVMVGDTVHLEFYFPGQGRRSREDRDEAKKSAGDTKGDNKKKPAPPSYEEMISDDYVVESTGIRIPRMDKPIPVVGKTLQEAADLAAQAFTDPLWAYEMGVDLTPVKRGIHYSGMGEISSPETKNGGATTKDTEALARRDKRRKFTELVPFSFVTIGAQTELAVLLYYREVDDHLDDHDDPEALWKWAQEEAEKRWEEIHKKTPRQEFELYGLERLRHVSTMPQAEQLRLYETHSRYRAWLNKQDDSKLAKVNPVDIWVQAYMNVFREEVEKSSWKAVEEMKEKRRQEAFKQAEVKFGKAIDFAMARIWPESPTTSITLKEEQISERTGEVVEVGYLIQASTAEKIIRDKIASDFLHSVLERLMKDPEAFNKTSVKEDFLDYMDKNPDQLLALQLTTSHPYVERQEHAVDIPAWDTATEVIVGLIPFVGQGVAIYELIGGRDLSGHPLTTTEKVILGVGILLPGIAKAVKGGKGAFRASRIVSEYGLVGAEADRVYKVYMGLAPGSAGARLFNWGVKEIKAGRAIDDPAVLKQMETVLIDLGMTEKETAKALLPAVERQAEMIAKEEVQALKTMTGPISGETEELLLKNAPLREALKENNLAARVLKKCNTPCWPEGATPAQVKRLEALLERLKKNNAFDEGALRQFLYERRNDLKKAIDEVASMASAAETAQAKTAGAATGAAKTAARKEPKVLDVTDQLKAAAKLKAATAEIAELKLASVAESRAAVTGRQKLVKLVEQPKDLPSSLKSQMDRINKLKTLEDRLEALDELGLSKTLSQAEKDFLQWRRQTWALQEEVEASEGTAKYFGRRINDLLTVKEVAAVELREASKDVMDVLRSNGPIYRSKGSINIDQVMEKSVWDALNPKPALATDHLVALDRISKMPELNEVLILYPKASAGLKAEIKVALQGLGDMEKNLVRMDSGLNSGVKSNKSWYDITYDMVKTRYKPSDVDKIRGLEDQALAAIKEKIAKLTTEFQAKVEGEATAKASKAAGAGAKK